MPEKVHSIPEDAMLANKTEIAENYVHFPATDVIEWFTVTTDDDGQVTMKKEQFISTETDYPFDVEDATGVNSEVVRLLSDE